MNNRTKIIVYTIEVSTMILFPSNPKLLIEKSIELALIVNRMVVSCNPFLEIFKLIEFVKVGVILDFDVV